MDSLFEAEFSLLTESGKSLSRCGICKHYMKYVKNPPPRLFCSECNVTYNLPPNGTIKLYKELKCPLDGFDLLLYSLGNSEKFVGTTYPLCPFCYNNPPFEELTRMGCNQCLHPSCRFGLLANGVCPYDNEH